MPIKIRAPIFALDFVQHAWISAELIESGSQNVLDFIVRENGGTINK
jgi:hypothetical protein